MWIDWIAGPIANILGFLSMIVSLGLLRERPAPGAQHTFRSFWLSMLLAGLGLLLWALILNASTRLFGANHTKIFAILAVAIAPMIFIAGYWTRSGAQLRAARIWPAVFIGGTVALLYLWARLATQGGGD
jgi:hypothetical protein